MQAHHPRKSCQLASVYLLGANLLFSSLSTNVLADEFPQTLAFEGALGFGKYTQGGSHGKVLHVTSLDDPKTLTTGTLRWAVTQPYPRHIQFDVSGIIKLHKTLSINADNLTLDGSTSKGGIVVSGAETRIDANQIIIRHMRFRPGKGSPQGDALTAMRQKDIIIDHCSLSWANDEVGSFYNNQNFTLQNSILSQSLRNAGHDKGEHGYGGIWGGANASFLRNLIAHHTSRNPRINGYRLRTPYAQNEELTDVRNNVVFNWGFKSAYGAEGGHFNLINNVYKAGPASTVNWLFELWQKPDIPLGSAYIEGNQVRLYPSGDLSTLPQIHVDGVAEEATAQQSKATLELITKWRRHKPLNQEPSTLSAEETYDYVLNSNNIGATKPFSDSVDQRVLQQVRDPKRIKNNGIIDSELQMISSWQEYSAEFTQFAQFAAK
ncbi:pectate lyase family protein [Alteromonas sp. a30]|uniref:pectate lyase family protein n=1 Tax=Alteromonas sp. a30 TaxID=2730917 RepID=UPI002282FCA8|nr:pectate lyase C [Alteromonas sp. a30]MCY7297197.1 pectate lyase C [Alteromonas sp. a30]